MLAPAPRLIQLEAHFMPYQTKSEVPKKDAFAKACGATLYGQMYDPQTGLLKFTLFYTVNSPMKSPRKSKEFLWGVLEKMGVFNGWYYYRIFVVDEHLTVHEQFLL